jgi:sarcosine oxidase
VVGIGTSEPEDWSRHDGPFASHYDAGRITRILDASPIWAELARRSIAEYPTIADGSGIDFHHPVGVLWSAQPSGLDELQPVAGTHGIEMQLLPAADRATPHVALDPANDTVMEPDPAGYIDPRAMVGAQQRMARLQGAELIDEQVLDVTGGSIANVRTESSSIRARTVVVAAGAYSGSLLEGPPIIPIAEAVVLGEVTEAAAHRMQDMPCLIHQNDPSGQVDVYLIPPVRYPDGRWYIKLGAETALDQPLRTEDDVRRWMAGADVVSHERHLVDLLTGLVPNAQFRGFDVKPCFYARTPSRLPYVDHLNPSVVVAAGGNGRAAKSADAIGSLAARLALTGDWDDPLPSTAFELPI